MLRSPAILALVACAALLALARERLEAGEKAPVFSLKGPAGAEVRYDPSKAEGAAGASATARTATVVLFIEPGQDPSRRVVSDLNSALEGNGGLPDRLRIIVVASGRLAPEIVDALGRQFPAQARIECALDPDFEVYRGYGVISVPTTFVIGDDGVVSTVLPGASHSYRKDLLRAIRRAAGQTEETSEETAGVAPTADERKVARLKKLAEELASDRRVEEAAKTLEEARKLAPADPDLLVRLGEAYLRLSRPDAAAETFREASTAAPTNTGARRGLLKALALTAEDLAAAEQSIRSELSRPPADPPLYYYLGRLLERAGKHAEAAAAYREAFERLRDKR